MEDNEEISSELDFMFSKLTPLQKQKLMFFLDIGIIILIIILLYVLLKRIDFLTKNACEICWNYTQSQSQQMSIPIRINIT
jgi:hypothetical protein